MNLEIIKIEKSDGFIDLKKRAKQDEAFLPYLYLNLPRETENKMCLSGGSFGEVVFDNEFALVHVVSRPMYRLLSEGAYSERVYAPVNKTSRTRSDYLALEKKSEDQRQSEGWQNGTCHLVFVLSDSLFTFATLEGCGTMDTFWDTPLSQAGINEGKKAVFNPDFSICKIKSRASGYFYYSKYKLSHRIESLTKEEIQIIQGIAQEQTKEIKEFLSR